MAAVERADGGDILVVPVDCANYALLQRLTIDLQTTLGHTAIVAPWDLSPQFAREPARGQYNSSLILAELFQRRTDPPVRLLGVTDVDLFVPVLTYVFGEAQMRGPAAVVSTFRLHPELYGLAPDPELLSRRLLVESVHELGHTAGLTHCHAPGCAMIGSTYAEEIDLKGPGLCERCREVFQAIWTE
jgi:archaemetzincin